MGMGGMSGMGGMNFGKQRTPDMIHELFIPLESIYTGRKKVISVRRNVVCIDCRGQGGIDATKCNICKGAGIVLMQQQNGPFIMQTQRKCTNCDGSGKTIAKENICTTCTGKGHKMEKNTVDIIIPAGVPNGHTITMKGMADEHVGYETGDLFIVIKIKPHEKYTRQGNDLITTVAINLVTALVGGIVQFEHLDGHQLNITLPKGKVTRHGDTVVTSNRGMPVLGNPGSFGDLRVTFHIEMPSDAWAMQVSDAVVRKVLAEK